MMYDFHYPLGRGKLNEDTANCRAKQSGMMGKNAGPASLSQSFSLSLCTVEKKEALLRLWGCDLRLLPTSLPAGVHRLSINQGLLTAETTLSHQHAISWVTDSTPTTLHSQFKQSCFLLCFLSPLTLVLSLYLPVCPPHLELLRNPNPPPRHDEDENKSWYNHKIFFSAKRLRGVRGRGYKRTG